MTWQSLYDELATERYPRLLAYATALTGDRPSAEDLLQDALVNTFGTPRRLHSAEHAERYVRRAMVNGLIDSGRRATAHAASSPPSRGGHRRLKRPRCMGLPRVPTGAHYPHRPCPGVA